MSSYYQLLYLAVQVLCELATSGQWIFDVSWCPRNPAVIASASFDGKVSVYSLLGGQQQVKKKKKKTSCLTRTG